MSGRLSTSVVIPAHNGAAFIAEALSSVFAQDEAPKEIIVVDDGSSDETAAIAGTFPGVVVISQKQQGEAGARNAGIAAATGDLIAFLDVDDLWAPEKIRLQREALEHAPSAGFAICHGLHVAIPAGSPPAPWLRRELFESPAPLWLPSALAMRRTALSTLAGFATGLAMGTDTDLFLRARDVGIEGIVRPEALLTKRIHGANLSRAVDVAQDAFPGLLRASLLRRRRDS